MARSAVIAGRILADTLRNMFVAMLMIGVGYALGFRFHTGIGHAVAIVATLALFSHAFSWISAFIGVSLSDAETVQVAGFVWLFPLIMSSAFVPVATMPDWLQIVAQVNPVTVTVDALRAMSLGFGEIWETCGRPWRGRPESSLSSPAWQSPATAASRRFRPPSPEVTISKDLPLVTAGSYKDAPITQMSSVRMWSTMTPESFLSDRFEHVTSHVRAANLIERLGDCLANHLPWMMADQSSTAAEDNLVSREQAVVLDKSDLVSLPRPHQTYHLNAFRSAFSTHVL